MLGRRAVAAVAVLSGKYHPSKRATADASGPPRPQWPQHGVNTEARDVTRSSHGSSTGTSREISSPANSTSLSSRGACAAGASSTARIATGSRCTTSRARCCASRPSSTNPTSSASAGAYAASEGTSWRGCPREGRRLPSPLPQDLRVGKQNLAEARRGWRRHAVADVRFLNCDLRRGKHPTAKEKGNAPPKG